MKIDHGRSATIRPCYGRALEWLRQSTIPEQGITVSSKQRSPYLEVTGYLIPTLFNAGEIALAERYAEFLSYMQHPNGGFVGPNGREYVFDTSQALRGLVRAYQHDDRFGPPALRAADYVASHIETDGRIRSPYGEEIPEHVHVFALPPLVQASMTFNEQKYQEKARNALSYYKNAPDALDDGHLTHFVAYTIDGFIEMGETEFVDPLVKRIFSRQRRNGGIPAYPNVRWTCCPGLAQLAVIGYKLGMQHQADKALDHLCRLQNPSGGFYGSCGFGADYFPREEISWTNKFFLDAVHLKAELLRDERIHCPSTHTQSRQHTEEHHERINRLLPSRETSMRETLDIGDWYGAIVANESVSSIASRIRSSDFPTWCKPLLQSTSYGDSTLELGSGTGQLSAILSIYGRIPHLMDYSDKCIEFGKRLFRELGIQGNFYHVDILEGIPMREESIDWVWSSGLLEHLSDDQIRSILEDSARVCARGVMSLVPNANSIFYRIGKYKMERERTWRYGRERPMFTMREYFAAAGLGNIREYSIGTYHALQFWGCDRQEIKRFYDSLSPTELQHLNQGYLLFTSGER